MALKHTLINFYTTELQEILHSMERIKNRGDKKSWMNLVPWLETADLPQGTPLAKFFSARGPGIPQGTWVPASINFSKPKNSSIGILHSAGRYAVKQLSEVGISVPSGWVAKQDHPRRGLVFEQSLENDSKPEEILIFMTQTCKALSEVKITDRWVADVLEQNSKRELRKGGEMQ